MPIAVLAPAKQMHLSNRRMGAIHRCLSYTTHGDAHPVSSTFLRGAKSDLLEVCPKFRNSIAPVLFHLPTRTLDRLLESIDPVYIGAAYVENGRSKFGTDKAVLRTQLPRFSSSTDKQKAIKYCSILASLVIAKPRYISNSLLADVLYVTGELSEGDYISKDKADAVVRVVLPLCFDKLQLSRLDIYKIVYALNRIPISEENAHVFPLVSNFATWYLERYQLNEVRRNKTKTLPYPGYERTGLSSVGEGPVGSSIHLVSAI